MNAIQCLPDSLRGMSFAQCTAESGHPEKIHCHLTTTDGRERPEFHRAGNKQAEITFRKGNLQVVKSSIVDQGG